MKPSLARIAMLLLHSCFLEPVAFDTLDADTAVVCDCWGCRLQMRGQFAALLAVDSSSINLAQELAVMVAAYNASLGQHAR